MLATIFLFVAFLAMTTAFYSSSGRLAVASVVQVPTKTALFSHHPQKKIIKKKMDRRPKKKRLSDIGRTTVNTGKCITKFPNLPAEFVILKAEDVSAAQARMEAFLAGSSPTAQWHSVDSLSVPFFAQNLEEPADGVKKVVVPPYVRSRSLK